MTTTATTDTAITTFLTACEELMASQTTDWRAFRDQIRAAADGETDDPGHHALFDVVAMFCDD